MLLLDILPRLLAGCPSRPHPCMRHQQPHSSTCRKSYPARETHHIHKTGFGVSRSRCAVSSLLFFPAVKTKCSTSKNTLQRVPSTLISAPSPLAWPLAPLEAGWPPLGARGSFLIDFGVARDNQQVARHVPGQARFAGFERVEITALTTIFWSILILRQM